MIGWIVIGACTGTGTVDSSTDSNTPDSPPSTPIIGVGDRSPSGIDHPIDWGCEASQWTYDFHTIGLSGGGSLRMVETDLPEGTPTDEVHPLLPAETDDEGWWTRFDLTLLVDDTDTWVPGATTNAGCEGQDLEALEVSWQLIVYEADGTTRADCAVWGAQPMWFEDSDCYIW